MAYSLGPVRGADRQRFLRMTFPAYRWFLAQPSVERESIAIGAYWVGEPVALGLARMIGEEKRGEVLSLFVNRSHRRRRLGQRLLGHLEQELAKRGCAVALLIYNRGLASAPFLERILDSSGWSQPAHRMLVCRANGRILEAPFFAKARLTDEYAIFPWKDVTEADRRSIRERQLANPWIPEDLLPEKHEPGMAAVNSLGLRYRGEVVGWMITHLIRPRLYRYTCCFVREDLARRLRGVALFEASIRRQAAAEGFDSVGIWTVPRWHEIHARFVRRRMAPYLLSLNETMGSTKRLP